ncbi:hypothetical protein V8H18_11360 [Lautropia mirabilis]
MVALAVAAALSGCAATQDAAQSAVSSVKSLAGQAQVTRQAVAPALYEVAYSPSQDVVYVVSAGGFGPDAPASKVLRLDPKTLDVKGEIPLSTNGFGLVLDDAAHRLYITDTRAGSLTVVDVAHDTVVGTVALNEAPDAVPGQKPAKASRAARAAKASRTDRTAKAAGEDKDGLYKYREVVLDRTHNRLYLPGMSLEAGSDGVLKVVDAHTLKVQKVVPGLGFGTTGIALDEAAGKLYVSNLVGQLFVVDTGTLAVTQKFEVAADQLLNPAVDRAAGRCWPWIRAWPVWTRSASRTALPTRRAARATRWWPSTRPTGRSPATSLSARSRWPCCWMPSATASTCPTVIRAMSRSSMPAPAICSSPWTFSGTPTA